MAGEDSQAGDADSSQAPGLTSGLQGSVNVHRGALLLVPQWYFCRTCSFCRVELVVQFNGRGSTQLLLCLFPAVLWLWHFLYSVGPSPVSSLHIYTFVVSQAFIAGVASQAGDADSSRAPGLTSGLQAGVRECPLWCSIVSATVILHQLFCILHYSSYNSQCQDAEVKYIVRERLLHAILSGSGIWQLFVSKLKHNLFYLTHYFDIYGRNTLLTFLGGTSGGFRGGWRGV